MTLRKGNKVAWRSTSRGISTPKIGTVVEIVPEGYLPDKEYFRGLYNTHPIKNVPADRCRNHDSYVVAVNNKNTSNGRPLLYWPKVANLVKL